jgi:hypothetical protein
VADATQAFFYFINRNRKIQMNKIMTTKSNAGTFWNMRMFSVFGPSAGPIKSSVKTAVCILAGLMLFTSAASAQQAYAMEFNQGNNLFGTVNLLNGSFTQLGTEGGTLFNDVAAAPDGTLYGIVNSASLVTINTNNGATLSTISFSVGGIESLAISADGTLYGASQGSLYTINAANGQATLIGNFNNSLIGNSGQNIRFAADGSLYDTDGGVSASDTDLFRISTNTGAASTMGVITNIPGLCLENSGDVMYGTGIQLGSANTLVQDLIGIDLASVQPGGTNLDGSIADLNYVLVTGNFPNNFNFSASDTFTVPGTPVTPVPEPGVLGLSLLSGMFILLRMRIRH